jgi:hypothetical protein
MRDCSSEALHFSTLHPATRAFRTVPLSHQKIPNFKKMKLLFQNDSKLIKKKILKLSMLLKNAAG